MKHSSLCIHRIQTVTLALTFLALALFADVQFAAAQPKCGYQSCPVGKPDMINVHLICHTHDDVGWVKTINEYYNKGWVTVKGIISSVVDELPKGSDRKFIYVETSYFWKWWQEQTEETQHRVRQLVESGQLEFAGGGWCMNDEATVYYEDVIDQMTLGLRKLRNLFGSCGIPKVAWQIDPFGHSREQASLFAQMGFDGLFIGRIHYNDKFDRLNNRQMEFIWNGSASLGAESQLFTGELYDEYSAPKHFCFDAVCGDADIIDRNTSRNNVNRRVSEFLNIIRNQSQYYATNHIMVTMGGDFTYIKAASWFENLDKLIFYTNKLQKNGSKFNLMYSTPSCYLKALHENKQSWTVKKDDFFPYANDIHSYWTGYFTSRPFLKRLVRKATNVLQTCRQIHFFVQEFSDVSSDPDDIRLLMEALSVAQHHDAVSGTAKQRVTDDYMNRLMKGIEKCESVISSAYRKLMSLSNTKLYYCRNLDVSQCDVSETTKRFTVTLYNPLARPVQHLVRLPVPTTGYKVHGNNGDKITAQLIPVSSHELSLPYPVDVTALRELAFYVDVPAAGFKTYFVKKSHEIQMTDPLLSKPTVKEDVILSNGKIRVVINGQTGLLQQVTDIANNVNVRVTQNFYYYNSAFEYSQASGAYIFRPNGTTKHAVSHHIKLVKIVKGPVVDEVHQVFHDWITQIIRLPKHANHVEMEWTVGPIPVKKSSRYYPDSGGKEVVSVFQTELDTQGEFYTDANGREIIKRRVNEPSMLDMEGYEPVAGNYYPVNTRIYIQDVKKDVQVTLLTDRSVGGSSLQNGSLEIMLHRKLSFDDGKGVDEALGETGYDGRGLVVRGKTLLLIDPISKAARHHRQVAQQFLFTPLMAFTNDSNSSWNKWAAKHQTEFSGLTNPLPPNVHLLTLEVLKRPYVLVRLEHFYEKNEDFNLSQPATVDIKALFKRSSVVSVRETTLGANQALNELNRFHWQQDGQESSEDETIDAAKTPVTSDFVIQLKPMQIRTFIVELQGAWATSVELGIH